MGDQQRPPFAYAGSMLGQRRRVLPLLGVALLVNLGALAVVAQGLMAAGLMPHAHAYSAMVSAMLGYQALHGAAVAMMVGYLMLRASAGLLGADQRTTLENVRLFYHYAVGRGLRRQRCSTCFHASPLERGES